MRIFCFKIGFDCLGINMQMPATTNTITLLLVLFLFLSIDSIIIKWCEISQLILRFLFQWNFTDKSYVCLFSLRKDFVSYIHLEKEMRDRWKWVTSRRSLPYAIHMPKFNNKYLLSTVNEILTTLRSERVCVCVCFFYAQ